MTNLDLISAKSAKGINPFSIETQVARARTPIRGGAAQAILYSSSTDSIENFWNNTFYDANWAMAYKLIAQDVRKSYRVVAAALATSEDVPRQRADLQEVLVAIQQINMPSPAREFLRAPLEALAFLDSMYKENQDEASSDDILTTIQTMFGWISQGALTTIDAVMKFAELRRLAPEIPMSILRTSVKIRSQIPEWQKFYSGVRDELETRELDADDLLQGL